MQRQLVTAFLGLALVGGTSAIIAGCDDTISEKKEVKVKDDGTVIKKTEKVEEKADGSIEKTETKEVDKR